MPTTARSRRRAASDSHRRELKRSGSSAGASQSSSDEGSYFDWVDQCRAPLDFFGCDENCAKGSTLLGESWQAQPSPPPVELFRNLDYASLHDELLDSLLSEQLLLQQQEDDCATVTSSFSGSTISVDDSDASAFPQVQLPKRRALRRKRKDSRGSPVTVVGDLSHPQIDPANFMEANVTMQKDKGKGEPLGTAVSAEGREQVLLKLRTKMKLLTEVTLDTKKPAGGATIKRKNAKIAAQGSDFVETRSLLELRMGFLSMQYGILLRWNVKDSGKVTFVVLRKMCHERFYRGITNNPASLSSQRSQLSNNGTTASGQPHDVVDDNAIMDRPDGTEVTLVRPPYIISRPDVMEESTLMVRIKGATGLSKNSLWTLRLVHAAKSQNVQLSYKASSFTAKSRFLHHYPPEHDLQGQVLQVQLLESTSRRKSKKPPPRTTSTLKIPLGSLPPTNAPIAMKLPILMMPPSELENPTDDGSSHNQHDNNHAQLDLVVCWKSAYQVWLEQELTARQREAALEVQRHHEETKEEEGLEETRWDWICHIC